MGVVRRVHPLPNRPEAFPGSPRQFVPDPPAGWASGRAPAAI